MPSPTDKLQLIAHRGYQQLYPENTLLSLKKAIEAGAQHIEMDVQFSQDGEAVLFHDRNLGRVCNRRGVVGDYSLEELSNFSAHEPKRFADKFHLERITTLDNFISLMQQHPEVHCFVEIKRVSLEQHSAQNVVSYLIEKLSKLSNTVTLISFSLEVIQLAKQMQWQNIGLIISEWQQVFSPTLESLSPSFIFANVDLLPRSGDLDIPHGKLAIYEIGNSSLALRLHKRHVNYIETFSIGDMISKCSQNKTL